MKKTLILLLCICTFLSCKFDKESNEDVVEVFLPKTHISARYIFSKNADFFTYPNNFNHYAKHYKNTFQHGGISLEEMIIPVVTLTSK